MRMAQRQVRRLLADRPGGAWRAHRRSGHAAAEILAFIGGGILAMGASLVTGAVAVSDIAAELPRIFLIAMLLLVLVLPILSTLLLVAGRDSRRVRVFYLITWGIAAVLSLLPVVFDATLRSGRFWGIWLYLGLAAGVLVLEILLFAAKSRSGAPTRPRLAE